MLNGAPRRAVLFWVPPFALLDFLSHIVNVSRSRMRESAYVQEARDTAGEPLGYGALESMLSEEPSTGSPSSWLSGLFDRVQRRTARVPEDDWTAAMLVPRDVGEAP